MKSLKIYFAILFITCLGCNNDNEVVKSGEEDSAIHFGSKIVGITQSKAIIDTDTLPANTRIGIFGWGHHKDEVGKNTTLRKDLNNALYTQVSGKDELDSDTHAHYPVNPDTLLNFYAYHPHTDAATADPRNIPFDLKNQHDLMWATPVTNRDKTSEAEKVELSFNHILSAITIKIKKADDIKEDMILESISLENYPSNVLLDVQTGKLTLPVSSTPYTIVSTNNQEVIPKEATIITNYLLCPLDKPVFIIRLSGNNFRVASTKAFLANKRQTYEFTIQAKDIILTGTIKPWEDGGSSEEIIYF